MTNNTVITFRLPKELKDTFKKVTNNDRKTMSIMLRSFIKTLAHLEAKEN